MVCPQFLQFRQPLRRADIEPDAGVMFARHRARRHRPAQQWTSGNRPGAQPANSSARSTLMPLKVSRTASVSPTRPSAASAKSPSG